MQIKKKTNGSSFRINDSLSTRYVELYLVLRELGGSLGGGDFIKQITCTHIYNKDCVSWLHDSIYPWVSVLFTRGWLNINPWVSVMQFNIFLTLFVLLVLYIVGIFVERPLSYRTPRTKNIHRLQLSSLWLLFWDWQGVYHYR